MKKLFTLIFMLSFLLLGGANATVKTVLSWDFATYAKTQTDKTFVSTSGTVKVGSFTCDLLTGDFAGLAVQGAAPNAQGQGGWMWRSAGNLYNANSGGRKLVILGLKKDDVITLTSGATQNVDVNVTAVDGETNKFTVLEDGNASLSITKATNITALTVSRDVPEGTCEDPTASVTGVNGTKRIITLACTTDASEIYYSKTELTTAEGGTKYENPFETDATTIYAYAKTETSSSNVISYNTGVGSEVTLATPTLQKTALTGEGYTVSLTSDQTGVLCTPTAKIMYSIDDAAAVEYSDPITLAVGSTIKAYATATGYANSANVEYTAVVPEGYTTSKALDFTSYAEGKGTNDTGSTINVSGTNLEKFLVDEVAVDADFYVQPVDGSYKFYVHVTTGDRGLYCYYGGGRLIGLANQKKDDIIKIKASMAPTAGANLQALPDYSYGDTYYFQVTADGNCGLTIQRYTYIRSIEVLTEAPAVTELPITNTVYFESDYDGSKEITGLDAEGNIVQVAFIDGSLSLASSSYRAADDSWGYSATSGTGTLTEESGVVTVDANVVFHGITYHITGTYTFPVYPLTEPTVTADMTSIKIVWTDEVISDNHGFRLAEGHVILTVGEDVYEGPIYETEAVSGKLTVTIPFDRVMHALTFEAYTPVNGDNISIKIEGAKIDAKATEESDWKAIWSGDIDGLSAIVDNTTGINSVSSAAAKNATIYNLAGQRVSAKAKGLVIKNGKKVFVK